jgi:hypothetical protein
MNRREVLKTSFAACAASMLPASGVAQSSPVQSNPSQSDRVFWLSTLDRVCRPLLTALSERKLHSAMPVETAPRQERRRNVTHLEAFGRALAGIAPWLEHGEDSGEEGRLLTEYRALALSAIEAAIDPKSPDYMHFGIDPQNIVDTSYLALALLRAPTQLQQKLSATSRTQLAQAYRDTRHDLSSFNNWLLFAAMIEAGLFALGEEWDRVRVDYSLREHASWYLGDGIYGDGPHFHWDYYDSYVIHPYLLQLMDTIGKDNAGWSKMEAPIRSRAQRYAAIQERLINTDGTFPSIGRSTAYRCGAFQLLADISLRQVLPNHVLPEQVRGALGAVIRRTLGAPNTFDDKGWLQIGLAGHQPDLGEGYISTGSLYLCTAAFLPLGLPASNPFWSNAPKPWTSQRIWSGENMTADHSLDI